MILAVIFGIIALACALRLSFVFLRFVAYAITYNLIPNTTDGFVVSLMGEFTEEADAEINDGFPVMCIFGVASLLLYLNTFSFFELVDKFHLLF